jgi:TPR repeat protein
MNHYESTTYMNTPVTYHAVMILQHSANQNHSDSFVKLGKLYKALARSDPDYELKAFEHLTKAMNMSNADGVFEVGVCYETGFGVNPNIEHAISLYMSIKENDLSAYINSRNRLYKIYSNVESTYYNRELAYKYAPTD